MQVALQNKFDVSCILLLLVWLKNQGMQGKGIKLALHVVENAKKTKFWEEIDDALWTHFWIF